MKIVEPYAKIIFDGEVKDVLGVIDYCGRISHRSEDAIEDGEYTPEKREKFLRSIVMNHGDMSIIEHCYINVEMLVDRGITHEIVRHRIGSYTQESTRFVNYTKDGHELSFIMPPVETEKERQFYELIFNDTEVRYNQLLDWGKETPQIARAILPNALASKIIVTYNLRSWRHFFIMRTTKEAHPQMKQVTIPLLREFQEKIPILFEDIVPEMKQSESMRLLR